jgi:uncharacterized repeat protein (TIGR01451 family)
MSKVVTSNYLPIALLVIVLCSAVASAQDRLRKDLEVTVQAPSNIIRAGEPFSYTATIRNVGSATAVNVLLSNDPPEAVHITSVSTSAGDCSSSSLRRGDAVSCKIGKMGPNATVLLSFTSNFAYIDDPESPQEPRPPNPPSGDWSYGVGSVSVDVIGDEDRSNNVARVHVDIEPRSNGFPLVRILSPLDMATISPQTSGRTEVIVKILAYDLDGSIDRVVVREPKYIPFPYIENGGYKFIYMGKKYTATQLATLMEKNPPPVTLARRTGKDTFEFTISDAADGPNQIYVEAFDNAGRSNHTSTWFFVNGPGVIETIPPKRGQIV